MMVLKNVRVVPDGDAADIFVKDGKIASISPTSAYGKTDELVLTFNNAIAFPGLINSHDHLDFNLFPKLGNKIYSNYTEWGKYIHENYKDEIVAITKIPVLLRAEWGLYKNLLCGVTTVVNHGEPSGMNQDLITAFEDYQCLHSVQFEKKWKLKLNNPFKGKLPVVVHVGEGKDWLSFNEIDNLINWNLFRKALIGVHGVSMSEKQANKFKALVWCPQSNFFMFDQTAPVNLLKDSTKILFGTDSTLTSSWNIWEHLRTARNTKLLADETLYETLNINAANTWKLNCGEIAAGKDADIVVAKLKNQQHGFDAFFDLTPADLLLVVHQGNIRLFDETLLPQLEGFDLKGFSKIYINLTCKSVHADLPGLMKKIKEFNPAANFPAGIIN